MLELTASRLKAWRLKAGLSQADVAAKLCISRSHYGNVENGTRPIMPRLERQLVDAYPGLRRRANQREEG